MYNDGLLELIGTFSPSEKNSFKRYISFTGGGRVLKYEELFNIYNKHLGKSYDKSTFDKKVKASLKKKPKLNKDLNNIRKRLKDKLLESLSLQNTSNSSSVEITKGIIELRILVDRKLYQTAIQKIKLLKDRAQSFNLNKHLIELNELEISLIIKNNNKNNTIILKNLIAEEQSYLRLYSIELDLKNIFCKMSMIVEKDLQLNKKEHVVSLHELNTELDNIPIKEHIKNKQVFIVLWFHRIKNLYFRSIDKVDLALSFSRELVVFFEKDKDLSKKFQEEYIKAICSYSRSCFVLNKRKELDRIIGNVQSIYKNQKNYNALEATCEMGVLHYLNSFQYNKANEIANLMDDNWQYFQRKTMDGKLLWYAHTNSILYWIQKDKQNFEMWVNRGLNIQRPHKGKMLLFGIRMLVLLHYYDTKELLHFNEKVHALQKTMVNNNDLKAFEKIVLKYLKKVASIQMSTHSKKEKATLTQTLFEEFKTALLNLKEGKTNFISPINYEEILLWCESHLQNKSIREVFEAKAN